jgi:hypothetical protein
MDNRVGKVVHRKFCYLCRPVTDWGYELSAHHRELDQLEHLQSAVAAISSPFLTCVVFSGFSGRKIP